MEVAAGKGGDPNGEGEVWDRGRVSPSWDSVPSKERGPLWQAPGWVPYWLSLPCLEHLNSSDSVPEKAPEAVQHRRYQDWTQTGT